MEIGKHIRTIQVEPIEDPFRREPAPQEPEREREPATVEEPVAVPA